MSKQRALVDGFLDSAASFPDRPAVAIQDKSLSYGELRGNARKIAGTLQRHQGDQTGMCGVYGHRSFAAMAGVLGALLKGDAYVPLNPAFPPERTLQMMSRAALTRFVVEAQSLESFLPLLADYPTQSLVVIPDGEPDEIPQSCRHHTFVGGSELCGEETFKPVPIDPENLAYLLFTSGSTGIPKGVMVKQSNVVHFVDYMVERYEVNEHDRLSQTFDLTFDLSAFDMFVAWEKGACLCLPTQGEKMLPGKYVTSQNLTIWFSVPSTAILMKKLRMLKPDAYPNLRYALFCGEALPLEVVDAFADASPNAVLENLYGPTELTIACTLYRYDRDRTAGEAEQGVVPIGSPYPGMEVLIADEKLEPVAEGEAGELLMTGPQLTAGYWQDEDKTAAAFVVPPGSERVFYRTGDRVRRENAEAPLLYLGRVDNQIKVQGYRVELGEIEARLRDVAAVDVAIAAGYPQGINGAEGIIAFIAPSDRSDSEIQSALAGQLPPYMQPQKIIAVEDFPLNANGKVDRGALLAAHEAKTEPSA